MKVRKGTPPLIQIRQCTGWIPPASPVSKSQMLPDLEGKRVKITGRIEMYNGKPEIRTNAAEQLELE